MQDDLYKALGLTKSASEADIRKAYRKIVRESHPDLNPDDPGAEERFKRASAAHDILKDPEKRRRYDAGEIDATGAERPQQRTWYRQYSERPEYGFEGREARGDTDFGDIFDELFGQRARARQGGMGGGYGGGFGGGHPGGGAQVRARGPDLHFTLEVDFLDAARGATTEIVLPAGDRLAVRIPEGTADGQTIRLRGKGGEGFGGGPRGDALVTVTVRPHRHFRREGDDILLTLPVTLDEAVLGAKVTAPTITGPVALTVPKGASSGQVLRLKGRGVKGGDQRVELKIVAPKTIDPELERFMEDWRKTHAYDPRRGMT